jgi:hypothetical protein
VGAAGLPAHQRSRGRRGVAGPADGQDVDRRPGAHRLGHRRADPLPLLLQMQPKGVVQCPHYRRWHSSEDGADALDRDGSHLLGLRFGFCSQPCLGCRKQGLKREHARGAAGDGNDCHHTMTQSGGCGVGRHRDRLRRDRRARRRRHARLARLGVRAARRVAAQSAIRRQRHRRRPLDRRLTDRRVRLRRRGDPPRAHGTHPHIPWCGSLLAAMSSAHRFVRVESVICAGAPAWCAHADGAEGALGRRCRRCGSVRKVVRRRPVVSIGR